MGNENYYGSQSSDGQLDEIGKNAHSFMIAGLLGGIIGMVSTLSSTYITLAMWPIGPLPYSAAITVIVGISRIFGIFAVILLITGVYGLSVQYKAPFLILVVALDTVVLILNQGINAYLATIGDFPAMVAVGIGIFIVGSAASFIFGSMLLSLRDHAPQPSVFTILGLIEIAWPLVYFSLILTYPSLGYIMSQAVAIAIGFLSMVLYRNELRRGPILIDDTSDWSQPPDIWE